ncbi:streptomycin biosynthesis protein StrI [Boeremia exigua]|uniref:streptomycin biosynthesis protein StrI n=1 Tax=Boeremia exigua TaxID=749465 RepID=UPI001E8E565A|nr:streptomycin biosynthesis protein StrI [Boeremia exigua]KAH6616273.1 streptomycin biosynthesis protein StrI [Boeremia exigua]
MAPYLGTPPDPAPTGHEAFLHAPAFQTFTHPPRLLIIGAGSRGTAYATAAVQHTNATIGGVCEPISSKRAAFSAKFLQESAPGQCFPDWQTWVAYEEERRSNAAQGLPTPPGVDAVFVCVLDEQHEAVVCGIAHLGLHVCCEKPLSTRLESCVRMYRALRDAGERIRGEGGTEPVFGICHVLRYSPHNMLLRHLVREKGVVGEVLSVEHTEPVGHWHFSHSYVRGNWRKTSTSAPSLLTKSCHDIDFLLWLLCTPLSPTAPPHLPSTISSTGSLKHFRRARKPRAAGTATNCLSCAHEPDCAYSAKRIYVARHLAQGVTDWPVNVVVPDIEDVYAAQGPAAAEKKLLGALAEDWDAATPVGVREGRNWFGRCVWEADNDVVDDQFVTLSWDEDTLAAPSSAETTTATASAAPEDRGPKTALLHMIAHTHAQCVRRGRIYGTAAELSYDSTTITIHDFASGTTTTHTPYTTPGGHGARGGHGGGDAGLVVQFLGAVDAVRGGMGARRAEREWLGCDALEVLRSHAVVFAAEEARAGGRVVEWGPWWAEKVGDL